jgi:hypothetical protein
MLHYHSELSLRYDRRMKCLGLLRANNLYVTAAYGRRIASEVQHRFGHSGEVRLAMLNPHTPEETATIFAAAQDCKIPSLNFISPACPSPV